MKTEMIKAWFSTLGKSHKGMTLDEWRRWIDEIVGIPVSTPGTFQRGQLYVIPRDNGIFLFGYNTLAGVQRELCRVNLNTVKLNREGSISILKLLGLKLFEDSD